MLVSYNNHMCSCSSSVVEVHDLRMHWQACIINETIIYRSAVLYCSCMQQEPG